MTDAAITLRGTGTDAPDADPWGWREEGRSLMRAVTGGAIVGMPLLYTMELWQHGMMLREWHLLAVLAAALLLNFFFSLVSGFRHQYSVVEAISESVSAVGIGLVFSVFVLWLIGELRPGDSLTDTLGRVVLEAAAVSVGVSFANSQVDRGSRTGEDEETEAGGGGAQGDPERRQLQADLRDAGATLAGATVFSLNMAPTEEILLIAQRLSPLQQLAMLAASLALCYVILFASGFEQHQVHVPSVFQNPLAETVMTCALSLLVAFVLLALLGTRETVSHANTAVAATITLGLPAAVGGAAGRLIV